MLASCLNGGFGFGDEIIAKNILNLDVHRSSLSRAKLKLEPELFLSCLRHLAKEEFRSTLWKSHRVRAIDGTYLILPMSEDIKKTFPKRRKDYYPQALLMTAVNVFTGQPVAAKIAAYNTSERDHLLEMMDEFKEGDIALLDRGYEGKKVWHEFAKKGQYFVSRIKANSREKSLYQKVMRQKRKDIFVEVLVGEEKMKLRVMKRYTQEGVIVLVTNLLKRKKYSRKELFELYKLRWSAETMYFKSKQYLRIQKWHTKKAKGVMLESFANLVALSMIAKSVYQAGLKLKNRLVSFKNAVYVFSQALIRLTTEKEIILALRRCWYVNPPDRHYPRHSKQPDNKWIKMRRPSNFYRSKSKRKGEYWDR